MAEPLVQIKNYSFHFGHTMVLDHVNLTLEKGEFLSIVGPNGAGKTTLLKCLDRILTGGRGLITIRGRLLDDYSQKELAKWIGYVPQASGPVPPFTVEEFVRMGRYPYRGLFTPMTPKDESAVLEALEVTGVREFSPRPLTALSAGERQKVTIAAALAQGTELLLLDEPATFLDPKHQDEIYALLHRVNRDRGVTILQVTHDLNQAVLVSGRVVALVRGKIMFTGSGADLMDNRILEKIYQKSFRFVTDPQTGMRLVLPEVAGG
ncbi:MAG: ABC transporter ATP-binding protein [Candidatus Tectomicrobia bacterium]|uniref:ABC transporter ATP-binding protein n=1 Tax=Tectimicrobiota bacterium TaxID=2528274 RepID=A0A932GPR4_UNCTE|nr:ABC transporter ATP-binding protein [Candidatus Tectomicrobia bacterium]